MPGGQGDDVGLAALVVLVHLLYVEVEFCPVGFGKDGHAVGHLVYIIAFPLVLEVFDGEEVGQVLAAGGGRRVLGVEELQDDVADLVDKVELVEVLGAEALCLCEVCLQKRCEVVLEVPVCLVPRVATDNELARVCVAHVPSPWV